MNKSDNTLYQEFLHQSKNLARIQTPRPENERTGNFSISLQQLSKRVDFKFDWAGEYGIIPYKVVSQHAFMLSKHKDKELDSQTFYLISKRWLEPYLKKI